jgi:protein involved in polysaccharide export with SLBB domain
MRTRVDQILTRPPKNAVQRISDHILIRHGLAGLALTFLFLAIRVATAADGHEPSAPTSSSHLPTAAQSTTPGDKGSPSPGETEPGGTKSALVFAGGLMDTLDNKQRLGVGDTVVFQVLEDQEDPKALSITDAGELHVPELGLVKAAGKTCRELAYELKSKLEQTTYYHATVILGIQLLNKTISGRRVYLAGQVRNTGPQEIPAGETWTVSRAIMGAGGFTDYADKKQVKLVRAGSKGAPGKALTLNVTDIWEKGQTEKDLPVEPEDLIYVPARAVNF